MTYEDYMNHAKKLYLQGVDPSGEQRRFYLTQALNVLNNLPDGYPEKDEMVRKINYML
mgnify:CR=1 FL=1